MLRAFVDLFRARRDRPLLVGTPSCVRSTTVRRAVPACPLLCSARACRPTGVPIRYDDPREVGADRIANTVARASATARPRSSSTSGRPRTSTFVSAAGEFARRVLAPGIEIRWTRSSSAPPACRRCPSRRPERVILPDDDGRAQSGLVYASPGRWTRSSSASARSWVRRRLRSSPPAAVSELIAPHSKTITAVDPELTLQGYGWCGAEPLGPALDRADVRRPCRSSGRRRRRRPFL